MNQPSAITELQRLAEMLNAQEIHMMISVGGAPAVYEYLTLLIDGRINHLQHQQEATR